MESCESRMSKRPSRASSCFKVDKPNTDSDQSYMINSAMPVAASGFGLGTFDAPFRVAYDTGTPAVGEEWGPEDGSWTLVTDSGGYVVLGNIDTTAKTMLVKLSNVGPVLDEVKGQLKTAMTSSDTTHEIDNVVVLSGRSPLSDASDTTEELTVDNSDFDWDGDDNAPAYAKFDRSSNTWRFYQVKCPA